MNLKSAHRHLPYLLAVSLIVILAGFSVFAYRERMLFIDPAWVAFRIVNFQSFQFAEHRYGAFITQLFPLTGAYLGLPLKAILVLYSVSFYLFYLGVALVLGLILRQSWLAILLALYLTLFASDGYYWPSNEVHQGIAWMFLFVGFSRYLSGRRQGNIIGYLLLVMFAVLAISSHLLVFVPLTFLWVFIHSATPWRNLAKDRQFIASTILLAVLMILKYKLSNAGWYDPAKLEGVRNVSPERILHAFWSGQSKTFAHLLLTNYWIAIPVFIGSCLVLIRSRQYLNLFALLLFSSGYYVLICLTFPDEYDRMLRFYMESEWAGLSVILAAPLVFHLATLSNENRLLLLLVAVFAIRLVYILGAYELFHSRYKALEAVTNSLREQRIHKALIIEADTKMAANRFLMDWGLPVESLLLSKINGDSFQTTFKLTNGDLPPLSTNDSFYSCFGTEPVHLMNPRYFTLDSTQQYHRFQGLDQFFKERQNFSKADNSSY